jgi:hypothetical protein
VSIGRSSLKLRGLLFSVHVLFVQYVAICASQCVGQFASYCYMLQSPEFRKFPKLCQGKFTKFLSFKDIVQPKQRRVNWGTNRLRTQSPTLKGPLLCFKNKKSWLQRLGPLKVGVFFDVECDTKNSEVCCDIALQLM